MKIKGISDKQGYIRKPSSFNHIEAGRVPSQSTVLGSLTQFKRISEAVPGQNCHHAWMRLCRCNC